MIVTDSLSRDFNATVLEEAPMVRATVDAYDMVKKHFPDTEIEGARNMKAVLEVIDEKIQSMQTAIEQKTDDVNECEKKIGQLEMVAGELRRQLNTKKSESRNLEQKVDQMMEMMMKMQADLSLQVDHNTNVFTAG